MQWDIRTPSKANPTSYIYGPLICGESIDMKGNNILTGSWRNKDQIQIWDIRNLKIPFNVKYKC